MKVLQCHSKGDKRFSALFAEVTIGGKKITIEEFYQKAKRLKDGSLPKKGQAFHHLEIFGKIIPKEYCSEFYDMIWVQYFMENKDLYEYAKTFDDYEDIFKGKSWNNQEKTIRRICKEGLESVYDSCSNIKALINKNNKIPTIEGDIFNSRENIIAHQTNCKGVMGAGIAKSIKDKYPKVFYEYRDYCDVDDQLNILGTVQIVEASKDRKIANVFGQYMYGRQTRQTNYDALRKALESLGEYAKDNDLSIAIPYKIGCANAGGDWNTVEGIILDVINKYQVPIVLYKFVAANSNYN